MEAVLWSHGHSARTIGTGLPEVDVSL
jgi:hypothetical protein